MNDILHRTVAVSERQACDVLVAGAGMAGCFAAIGAAGEGRRVVLVETANVLGGQGTAGGVAGFCGDTARVNAPFRELLDRLSQNDWIEPYGPNNDRRAYDLEMCAWFLEEMMAARDISVLLHSQVIHAEADEGRVRSVLVATRGGIVEYTPDVAIDATGCCALASPAGFETVHEGANRQLPMSLYFTLWDTGRPVTPFLPDGCPTWDGDDDLPMTTVHRFPSGRAEVKMKVVGFDAADGHGLSGAELHARRQMMGLIYHLQTKGYAGKQYPRHVLASVSRTIGIREERRIVGEAVLSEDEVMHGMVFDDAVAVGTYHLDYHWPDRVQRAGTGICTMVEPYHIPLRSLVPRGACNVLVPGRAASGDQMAMSSFRVMATCAQMGFAAGRAARQCLADRTELPGLDVHKLQAQLEADGQTLDLSRYGDYLRRLILVHEHCFEPGAVSFASCHASTLLQLENNRFLVAYFAGSREGHNDVGICVSERFQGRWTPPCPAIKVSDEPHWNPVLFGDDSGRIHLFFKVGKPIACWRTWKTVSEDGGKTWGEAAELVPDDVGGRGPVKNKICRLSDGTLLAPASTEEGGWNTFVDRSEDGGLTWTATDPIPVNRDVITGPGVIQPTIWESEPGQVHMLLRSTCGFVCRSDSSDGGRTWSRIEPTSLPNNNSGLDLACLPDGTLALVCNPVPPRVRTPLSLLLSSDNGQTWPRRLDIETDPGEYSYPAIIPTSTGLAITYTWNRKTIAFWHGSIERVPERPPDLS